MEQGMSQTWNHQGASEGQCLFLQARWPNACLAVLPFQSIFDYPKRASSDWLRNKSRGLCLCDRLKPNYLALHITCLIPRLASIGRGHSKFSWKWQLPMWKAGLTQSSANKVTGHTQDKRSLHSFVYHVATRRDCGDWGGRAIPQVRFKMQLLRRGICCCLTDP